MINRVQNTLSSDYKKVFLFKMFIEMLKKVTSSKYYDQMIRFIKPLQDYFGINHFWYYHISCKGLYCYVGSHTPWNEYCFENQLLDYFPCLKHPDKQSSGIHLMKPSLSGKNNIVLQTAWEKFGINFTLNLSQKTDTGIEAFGFATQSNHLLLEEKMLNELPLIYQFLTTFKKEQQKLLYLLCDNQVDIASYLGPQIFLSEPNEPFFGNKEIFLKKMGLAPSFNLTPREKEILRYTAKGYSAPYIATTLSLSKRTVENYIATMKSNLFCHSKIELIKKAEELSAIGYLNI